jgi:hypothetical protein
MLLTSGLSFCSAAACGCLSSVTGELGLSPMRKTDFLFTGPAFEDAFDLVAAE